MSAGGLQFAGERLCPLGHRPARPGGAGRRRRALCAGGQRHRHPGRDPAGTTASPRPAPAPSSYRAPTPTPAAPRSPAASCRCPAMPTSAAPAVASPFPAARSAPPRTSPRRAPSRWRRAAPSRSPRQPPPPCPARSPAAGATHQGGRRNPRPVGANTYTGGTIVSAGTLQIDKRCRSRRRHRRAHPQWRRAQHHQRSHLLPRGGPGGGHPLHPGERHHRHILRRHVRHRRAHQGRRRHPHPLRHNTYAGGTLVLAGTLQISADVNLGASTAGSPCPAARSASRRPHLRPRRGLGGGHHPHHRERHRRNPRRRGFRQRIAHQDRGRHARFSRHQQLCRRHPHRRRHAANFAEANLGGASGVTLAGGTLATTADLTTARAITLAAGSTVSVAASTTATFSGLVADSGALTKTGAGTLVLSGTNTYSGGTFVAAGTNSANHERHQPGRRHRRPHPVGGTLATAATLVTARDVTLTGGSGPRRRGDHHGHPVGGDVRRRVADQGGARHPHPPPAPTATPAAPLSPPARCNWAPGTSARWRAPSPTAAPWCSTVGRRDGGGGHHRLRRARANRDRARLPWPAPTAPRGHHHRGGARCRSSAA